MYRNMKIGVAAVAVAVLVTVYACKLVPGIFSGGGTIPNTSSQNGKSTFGFTVDTCNDTTPNLSVNYVGHDGTSLISTGDVFTAGQCVNGFNSAGALCLACNALIPDDPGSNPTGPTYAAGFEYVSRSAGSMGQTGTAVACFQDNGQGANAPAPDFAGIVVTSGPFTGYAKSGPVSGNVQSQPCS